MTRDEIVRIHTDGACIGNPGPGGWGAVLRFDNETKELHGSEPTTTTNNRMELTAPIMALESLDRPTSVHMYTDSAYVCDGITKWLPRWKTNGWLTQDRQAVKNADLWRRLEAAARPHQVEWFWVRAHAGDPGNERADLLAGIGARMARQAA
ncbi:ribonuclease HI [Kibdelosporangium lantanae]|uniref:Ribonuclease H n=1 Tax=Kibdelosporangium lantanae TaxID=1497396 RepID=A0ABW3MA22_9PSEU